MRATVYPNLPRRSGRRHGRDALRLAFDRCGRPMKTRRRHRGLRAVQDRDALGPIALGDDHPDPVEIRRAHAH